MGLPHLIGVLLTASPLAWELWNDRNGDAHVTRAKVFEPVQVLSKRIDFYARMMIAVGAGLVGEIALGLDFFEVVFLSGAIHFAFFDYLIAWILIRKGVIKGHWFSYLGKKGFDNWGPWQRLSPFNRLVIRMLALEFALVFYLT